MKILLELNEKYKKGFQVHCIASKEDGDPDDLEQVIDFNPYSLWKAKLMAAKALEVCNTKLGTHYELKNVIEATKEAVRVNARNDINSARLFREFAKLAREEQNTFEEDREKLVDYICGAFVVWNDELDVKAESELKRFCEYIASESGGSADKLYYELSGMPVDDAVRWIDEEANKVLQSPEDVTSIQDFIIEVD